MTISILEKIESKPSKALEYMIQGLVEQSKREDFKIALATYGNASEKMCYGCVATTTIQAIACKNLTVDTITNLRFRAKTLGFNVEEMADFEEVMDSASRGILGYLFEFCGISFWSSTSFNNKYNISADNWQEEIPKVRLVIEELKLAGY